VFFIKVDVMQLSADLTILGTLGEVQLEEFAEQLQETIGEGSLAGRAVLYDRSGACLMTCRNDLWLGRLQQMVLASGASRIAEVVSPSAVQSPALAPHWQRFHKLAEAHAWVIRRGDEPRIRPTNDLVTQLFCHPTPALRRAG
jgi:hypothetical protein